MSYISTMTNMNDVQALIDYCADRCNVNTNVEQIETYMEIMQEANNRLQALDYEFASEMQEQIAV